MKTYAETQGKAPFDWNAFLAKESYTQRELENAIELSEHWVTCACGNLCNIIPRNQEGIPLDHMLRVEGDNFTYFLRNMRYGGEAKQHAISTLHAIESRSQEIINDLKNKKMKSDDKIRAKIFHLYKDGKAITDEGNEFTLTSYNLNYYSRFFDECKIVLTALSKITYEDAIEVAKIISPLPFHKYPNGWGVERDDKVKDYTYITISHNKNIYSFQIDCACYDFSIYNENECVTCEHQMNIHHVVDFLRSKGYALPYMGIDLFEAGIAIEKQ